MNLSILTGIFPDCWKLAQVLPLFKDGDKCYVINIGQFPSCWCLVKYYIHKSMIFFSDNNLFHYAQKRFRKGHPTVTCATLVSNDILVGFNRGLLTGALFFYLKKACDTVDHFVLCYKLAKYGMAKSALKWIHSYLTDRVQGTIYAGTTTSYKSLNYGVP